MSNLKPGSGPGPQVQSVLIAYLNGADLNTKGDQQLKLTDYVSGGAFVVDEVIFFNCSGVASLAGAGVFTAVTASGAALVPNMGLAAMSVRSSALGTSTWTTGSAGGAASRTISLEQNAPYLNVSTVAGSAMTMDVNAFGRVYR